MATVEVAREDIIKRHLEVMGHDVNAVVAQYAPDAVVYDPITPQGRKGRDAIRKFHENVLKAFKDIDNTTPIIISKGELVAVEWVSTVTNGGPVELPTGTLAATNRRITFRGATFYRFNREGLIAEARSYYDMAGLLQQLGLKP